MSDPLVSLASACRQYLNGRLGTDPAHDLAHVERVVHSARQLAEQEGADLAVVLPAAWLHDCVTLPKDAANRQQASRLAAAEAGRFLTELGYPAEHLPAIGHAIEAHSFSAGIEARTLEAKIVQDADRLDALGAIGVARCLLVGGALQRPLYNTTDPFCHRRAPDDRQFSIDHFYRKLLQLADGLHTGAARREASRRLPFMRQFLDQLASELPPRG
ncbi:HD domain-containing protein [Marinobacterium arenosum]|uniref:HD domain-containing protein n=1 Tax=Marinobacterium arenosum TaxID=2862496 RepID=UPI001C97C154|nr:HD domain-containing protein [Marinobacterium arenosum]MBY4678430.1 HD domain-containing protein [Marinobacterium arenosum]